MRTFIEFLKTTIIGGFFVLLPVVIVLFLITLAVATVVEALIPLMKVLPIKGVGGLAVTTLAAILLLLAFCFLTGLLVQMRLGRLGKEWLERSLLERLPGYTMFKNLSGRIAGKEGIEFAPGLMDLYGSEARAVGFIIEEHENGTFTIFIPPFPHGDGGAGVYPARKSSPETGCKIRGRSQQPDPVGHGIEKVLPALLKN